LRSLKKDGLSLPSKRARKGMLMRNAERSLGHRLVRLGFVFAFAAGSWIGPTSASALPLLGATLGWDADGLGNGSVNLLSLPGITCDTTSKTGSCSLPSIWTPLNGYYAVNSFSSSWNPDPFVTNNFNVTNNSGVTMIFDVTVTSPVVLTGPQTAMSGSLGITLTNTTGTAVLTDASAAVYRALIDGAVVRSLFPNPYALTCTSPFCSTSDSDDFGIFPNPPEIGPQANTDIAIRIRFALSPGDSAGITSVFNIEAVPEPNTASLFALGVVAIVIARRRRRAV
jgi:hypothetical protein